VLREENSTLCQQLSKSVDITVRRVFPKLEWYGFHDQDVIMPAYDVTLRSDYATVDLPAWTKCKLRLSRQGPMDFTVPHISFCHPTLGNIEVWDFMDLHGLVDKHSVNFTVHGVPSLWDVMVLYKEET
jgi:hypothetical protein